MKLNREVAAEHLSILKWANESWFYGYHWSESDQDRLDVAIKFFEYIQAELKRKGKNNEV